MKTIKISRSIGLDPENLPLEIFEKCQRLDVDDNGWTVLTVYDESLDFVMRSIASYADNIGLPAMSTICRGHDTYELVGNVTSRHIGIPQDQEIERVRRTEQIQQTERPISLTQEEINARIASGIEDYLRHNPAPRGTTPLETAQTEPNVDRAERAIPRATLNAIRAEEEEYEDEDEDEDDNDPHFSVPHVTIPSEIPVVGANIAISGVMNNTLSNRAHEYTKLKLEFDRTWTNTLSMKRRLDSLSEEINSEPTIKAFTDQVESLRNDDNMIQDVFFSGESVIVETKELSTDQIIDGSKRLVGKMLFDISLKPFFGSPSKMDNPITIKNLDRVYHDQSGDAWECGHVPSNGGNPCFGTGWEQLFNAFVQRDLASVVEVLIRFVKNPNIADIYASHMVHWPPLAETSATEAIQRPMEGESVEAR